MFVEVTGADGKTLYVNPDHVKIVREESPGQTLMLLIEQDRVVAKEPLRAVMTKLAAALDGKVPRV